MVRVGTQPFVALLRGINVGGRNKIAMAELREAFESEGYGSVSTYIQSGNVVFEADGDRGRLERDVESLIWRRFELELVVVARSLDDLRRIVGEAPDGFGSAPDVHHYDVMFLKAPLTAARAIEVLQTREGVDEAWPGEEVVYFSRLSARRAQSRMSRVTGTDEYALMTIRNWNTTTRLFSLLEPMAPWRRS